MLGSVSHRVQVAREPPVMKDDDSCRVLSDGRGEILGIEVEVVVGGDVAEHRGGAGMRNCVGGRDEVEGREYDLVTRAAPGGEEREVKRRGAVRDGECVSRAAKFGVRPLELGYARAHTPPTGRHRLGDRGHHVLGDGDVRQWYAPRELSHVDRGRFKG